MAAHTYAKTPTAIAQFLVNRVQMFLDELDEKLEQITEGAQEKIAEEQQRLKDYAISLQDCTRNYLKGHNERIIRFQEAIRQKPAVALKNYAKAVFDMQGAVKKAAVTCLASHRLKLTGYQKIIDIVHPANTIKRGFSVTRTEDGKILKNIRFASPDQKLTTEITDGFITSEIRHIKKTSF
jgi:exodeoxyribonuclease VII large subunit